jgi:hypothetical protein
MGRRLVAMGASAVLVLSSLPRADAETGAGRDRRGSASAEVSGGIRTDRLTRGQLKTWKKIVALVVAEGRDGQPLHPTLRRLWDAVDHSRHVVHVEMPDTKSYFAGRFEITSVDPEGRAHEGLLILNLRGIDRASTGRAAARANGFVPFKGLDKTERYAEVLGHELGHAVWHLASVERARLAARLQDEMEKQAGTALTARLEGRGEELRVEELGALEQLARELEEPAETAEEANWEELQVSRRQR